MVRNLIHFLDEQSEGVVYISSYILSEQQSKSMYVSFHRNYI